MRTGHRLTAVAAFAAALSGCSSDLGRGEAHDESAASSTQSVTFSPSGDRARIRIVHWNIAGGVVAFQSDFPFLNANRPHNMGRPAPVMRLIRFIEEWQPDVISVNEITAVQYAGLLVSLRASGLTVNGHFVTTGFNVGPAGMAILTTAPATERETYYWNGTAFEQDGEQTSRAIACLTADLGEPVRVCTTHLETTDSIAATQMQSVIRDWSADLAARPTLFIGDLNAEPNILGGLLYPPNVGNGCFGAGGPFVEADMSSPECGAATHGEGKIDYVLGTAAHFTDQGFAEVRDGGDCVLTLAGRHPCSDHRAVLAEMELRLFDHGIGEANPSYAGPDVRGNAGFPINLYGRVPDGATSVLWTYAPSAGTDPEGSCVFVNPAAARTTITCDRPGTYVATLTVDGTATDSALVRITNVAPEVSITGPAPWQLFTAGASVGLRAAIEDSAGDSHTCTVDWDDGTTEEYPATAAGCARSHVYTAAGMYTIRLTVSDSGGASDRDEVLVVVHDPAGGWANLDGSLFSPAGALVDSTVPAGEVWAHLTGRYYDLNPAPVGPARAWLPRTDFRFEPTRLDWMVVTPLGRVAARATGSFAGQPGYGLLLYGQDGCNTTPSTACQPGDDQGRVIVWPLSAGSYPAGTITYDSSEGGDNLDLDEVRLAPFLSGGLTLEFPVH